jgi:hypothetical protein
MNNCSSLDQTAHQKYWISRHPFFISKIISGEFLLLEIIWTLKRVSHKAGSFIISPPFERMNHRTKEIRELYNISILGKIPPTPFFWFFD